ncbi:hypothetical protein CY652_11205 [Burkholderia sp. WAC0059]|uniref:hypothetical protein n=1 Tax=Burkholderia sp. WAC0059 TaxID=2066022 RepID=UPI000C7F62A6|nr:hypothetical protein [Burkholderia sp. WAC0059]PLZ02408.1 hypothetical protein CY652_11205 [Burkholderia sp. WAC0059]
MWWKACAIALLGVAGAAYGEVATPPVVHWTLEVVRDGQTIDTFDASTPVGQAHTDTHHHVVAHDVGCKDQPGGSIDLERTLTVSPTAADATDVTLAIDAHDTLEDDPVQPSPEGCRLPPQPRTIAASHPGLRVPAGQWADWQIVRKDPSLVYRVRANLVPQP